MAYKCDVCGKGPSVANSVSHSNKKTKRRQLPNLRRAKVNLGGTIRTIKVCTRCLKTPGRVQKVA